MFIDSTTRSLEVVLAGAVTTNQLVCTCDFTTNFNDASTSAPGTFEVLTNGATPVAVTNPTNPAASYVITVQELNIFNADTVAATVKVQTNNSGTRYVRCYATLQPNESLHYSKTLGFFVIDANGNRK